MSDLLSAATLLLTVLTILYGLWYGEITKALEIKIESDPRDRTRTYQTLRSVLYNRAVPLMLAAWFLTLIFAPDTISIMNATFRNFRSHGLAALADYSAVATAFELAVFLSFGLAIYLSLLTKKMFRKAEEARNK